MLEPIVHKHIPLVSIRLLSLTSSISTTVREGDCLDILDSMTDDSVLFDLTFLDPPFNQGKDYDCHNDQMSDVEYWDWMLNVCRRVYALSSEGAAIYFMQREKNTESVLRVLRQSGWSFQNLIVWKKMTSAIPGSNRFGKAFQVIAYATKGKRPRVFNRLRINPPVPEGYVPRENGVFVTDVWDDIRELTSGYYAGDEPIRDEHGERLHKQQSPVALLLRIILSSSMPGDLVLDPFAGTGTTLRVANHLGRHSLGIEKSPRNVDQIRIRLARLRESDDVSRFMDNYSCTPNLETLWGGNPDALTAQTRTHADQFSLAV